MSFFDWTDEKIELLKKLWDEGFSKGIISRRLGCTRNSVSGKLNRLGLLTGIKNGIGPKKEVLPKPKPPQSNFNPFSLGQKKAKALPPPLTSDQKDYILGQGISLLELAPHHCRWPISEPPRGGEYLFCGAKIESKDCPYCGYHARMAYGRAA